MVVLAVVLLLFAARAPAVSATDDAGRTVSLEQPAERIVSLSPHGTELLFAAGAGDRVVGVVSYSDYPAAAGKIPRVGGYDALDLETILALQPDLVVGWESGNGPDVLERLESLGLTLFVTEPRRLEQVPASIEKLGRLAGSDAMARQAADHFQNRLQAITDDYSQRPAISVFYQVWDRPLMTVGGDHLISRIIERCGGRNVFAELSELAPTISEEGVITANPRVIIASGMGEERPEWLDDWHRWKSIDAVARNQLHFIPPDLLQRPTPRALEGAERLCRALEQARHAYGEAR
ncbi:iron complex transport system substrate-binding protein [Thiohalomonas denitrificans]|uniref:Iron complex transport system substrate-binding protein n=2 Tax=Thiohalomonas denitrificans TaxID=415747 RepID=A0A1G5PMP3_9GAMM|nr:iron complex transport system substrate-binding protein [Thiohalomonas denitrificans]